MAISYFRWVKAGSVDIELALGPMQQIRSHYLDKNDKPVESRSAVWMFRMDLGYRPGSGIVADRKLIKIVFDESGEAVMESADNHLNFEDPAFAGEAKHPLKIIVKANEPGARGVGATILGFLNARVSKITEASPADLKRLSK